MTDTNQTLTKILKPAEQARFELLEKVCIEGRVVFYMVGNSLTEIKEKRFFVARGFETFEEYAESIGYSKRYCNQLILDAAVLKSLPENLRELIKSERAARELAKIPEPLRGQVAVKATAGGTKPATAASVKKSSPPPRATVAKKIAPPARKPAAAKPGKAPAPKLQLDETGVEIPPDVQPLWDRGHEAHELMMYCQATISKLENFREAKDPLFTEVDFNNDIANLKTVVTDLKRGIPFAVCPSCSGKMKDGCTSCKGRGFVSKFYWTQCVPEETRQLRPKGWKGE